MDAASVTPPKQQDHPDKSKSVLSNSQMSNSQTSYKYSLLTRVLIDGDEQSYLSKDRTSTLQQSMNVGVKLNQLLQEIEDFTKEHNAIVDRNNGTYAKLYLYHVLQTIKHSTIGKMVLIQYTTY